MHLTFVSTLSIVILAHLPCVEGVTMPSFLGGISYSDLPFASTFRTPFGVFDCGEALLPCMQSMVTNNLCGQPEQQSTPLPPTTSKPCARSFGLFPKL